MLTVTKGGEQRAYTYNGDGTLVAQTANGVQTHFTQDLAAPLSQILQTTQGGATTSYLYGLERLASVSGSTRTLQLVWRMARGIRAWFVALPMAFIACTCLFLCCFGSSTPIYCGGA